MECCGIRCSERSGDLPPARDRRVAGGALRHAESDAAMVMAEQTLEVPAGAARALLVGVEKDAW